MHNKWPSILKIAKIAIALLIISEKKELKFKDIINEEKTLWNKFLELNISNKLKKLSSILE